MYNLFMKFRPQELIKWLEEFTQKCDDNGIWYAADRATLLGTQKHGGLIPWDKRAQVMMTNTSYAEFKRLFPHHIIDSSIDKSYKSLMPSFIDERSTWRDEKPFVQIRIVVASTLSRIKNFKNPAVNVLNFAASRKDNTKIAINDLLEKRHEGFFTITSRNASLTKNWYPTLSFETKEVTLNDMLIKIPVDFKELLTNWYGENYMDGDLPDVWYEYPAPLIKTKFDSRKEK